MNILTAEEFLEEMDKDNDDLNSIIERAMIEFAKMHVEAALKLVSENADIEFVLGNPYDPNSGYCIVDKDSILNAYPLTNIK